MLDHGSLAFVRELVRRETGVALGPVKDYHVQARLELLAERTGFGSADELVWSLRTGADARFRRETAEGFLNNETWFFRDFHPFEHLRETVLPEMLDSTLRSRRLHVWSAACSSGQEPYSIAMLLKEMRPTLREDRVRIFASDLSKEMLRRTREATYTGLEVNRGLPAALLVKYFREERGRWRLRSDLRSLVAIDRIHLARTWPARLPRMDIVFLRNVLMYFDDATRSEVLARVAALLRPGGYLYLGTAETTLMADGSFESIRACKVTCFRRRQPAPRPSAAPGR